MKIVNLEAFRALPPCTFFRKFQPMITGDLEIKFETWEVDFISMHVDMPEHNGSDQLFARLEEMLETGASYPLEIDMAGRDGLFEEEQMFLIYEREDLLRLSGLIDMAIKAAT